MSVFMVNHVCRQVLRDEAFRAAMHKDPYDLLAGFDLTEPERRAISEGDVAALYRDGANEFLLGYLMRFGIAGLTLQTFNERMRGAGLRHSTDV